MRRALTVAVLFVAACSRPAERPPIILISIDTLRADHLPAYGYRAIATPNIDALARDGVVFRNAWSHCPLTLPSHLSILTGLLPPEHGVRDNAGYHFDGTRHATLASLLRARGYATGAAVSTYVLRAATGISAGFDDYDDAIGIVDGAPLGALQRPGTVTEQIAERWIDVHREHPFFYFLHLYEPHTPYEPTYDADIVKSDGIAGALLADLKRLGIYDRALIILVSDHGEGLMEHGEAEHGVFLYREDLRVPLIVKLPHSSRRGNVDDLAQLIDVAPSILAIAGVAKPDTMRGSQLTKNLGDRAAYAESFYPRIHLGWSDLRSIVRGDLHVIDAPKPEVYEMGSDPAERRNVLEQQRRAFAELRTMARMTAGTFAVPEKIGGEEAKKLAALGYVSGGSETSGALPDPKDVIAQLDQLKQATSVADLRRLLDANPRWSDVRDRLGADYDRLGDHASAARVYEQGIATTPRLAGTFALSAGYSLLAMHDVNAAESHAQLALSAGEPGAHLLLGEIALARGDLESAARQQLAADGVASQKAHGLFLGARIAVARHDFADVLQLLDAVQRERVHSGESLPEHFHYVAGDALAHTNRPAQAEAEMNREIAADPHFAPAYEDLALLQFIAGRPADANATIERLAATHPDPQTCIAVANELETFHDHAAAEVWRRRARVAH
jgi:tetratricopeptide (TPR) repeat protein